MGDEVALRNLNNTMVRLNIQPNTKTIDTEDGDPILSESPTMKTREEAEIANEGWPWVGAPTKLLTQAPFALNQYNYEVGFFKLPEAKQTSPLFKLRNGMSDPLFSILFRYHASAGKLAATCQTAFDMLAFYIDHWDVTRGEFLVCDKDEKTRKGLNISVGNTVVVTQFRTSNWASEHYDCEMFGLQNMTHAFYNYAEHFRTLHLHRIPLLTTHLLALVIPLMRRLKVLGIYQCQLIHIANTLRLLEIIRTGRGSGMTQEITLDFYPRFHIGPLRTPGSDSYTGSYGVTWDNSGIDTRLAIWALVSKVLNQSQKQGAGLLGEDSAFKLWLEKSPCWRIDDTLIAIQQERNAIKLATQLDFPHTLGRMHNLIYGYEWCTQYYRCRGCKEKVFGIFFHYEEWTQAHWFTSGSYEMLCLGCMLSDYLSKETDHKKPQKMNMVKSWLGNSDGTWNEDDIHKALEAKSKLGARKVAQWYDDRRREEKITKPGPEKQRPYRSGARLAPTIHDREEPFSIW